MQDQGGSKDIRTPPDYNRGVQTPTTPLFLRPYLFGIIIMFFLSAMSIDIHLLTPILHCCRFLLTLIMFRLIRLYLNYINNIFTTYM